MISIYLFSNGTTAFLENTAQRPEYQVPWMTLVCEDLAARGIDPSQAEFIMPDGRSAVVTVVNRGEDEEKYVWHIRGLEKCGG